MPICPKCGGWVSEGSSTCSCGTLMEGNSYRVVEEVSESKIADEMLKKIAKNHLNGQNAWKRKQYDEAIAKYKQSLDTQYNGSALKGLAELYRRMKKYDDALYYYKRLIEWEHSLNAYYGIGRVYAESENIEEALDNFNMAIEKINEVSYLKRRVEFIDDDDEMIPIIWGYEGDH